MTPEYDIPPCEEGVGMTHNSSGKYHLSLREMGSKQTFSGVTSRSV